MYEGVTVTIGGENYIVPPLNFKQLRAFKPKLARLGKDQAGDLTEEQMDIMSEVIHAALTRNYPDLTRERIEEMLDLGNIGRIFKAAMNASGLEQQQGEAKPRPEETS